MLLRRIEEHMRRTKMPPTRFGRCVLNDPNLVFDLRAGRELRACTARKVEAWLAAQAKPDEQASAR